jgi:hypothetical protein
VGHQNFIENMSYVIGITHERVASKSVRYIMNRAHQCLIWRNVSSLCESDASQVLRPLVCTFSDMRQLAGSTIDLLIAQLLVLPPFATSI